MAVPVPDAGIPSEVVDAARAVIENNHAPSKAGRRFWELSGGIIRCGLCATRMQSRSYVAKGKYHYSCYHCRKNNQHGEAGCSHKKSHRANRIEATVWGFVSELFQDPNRLRQGLEDMIEREREGLRGDPDRLAKVWLEKLAEVDGKRSRFQDMAAEVYITFGELGAKLTELEEARQAGERELADLQQHGRV